MCKGGKRREINGLGKVKSVKFIDRDPAFTGGEVAIGDNGDWQMDSNGLNGAIAVTEAEWVAAEGFSGFLAAVWPCEGMGIEGSRFSMLLFELGSNDHEFSIVIMG